MAPEIPEPRTPETIEEQSETTPVRIPLKTRLLKEVRTHPFGYSVLAIFLIAGPLAAPFLFPQAPPGAAIVGGLAFGIYAAVSAVPQKFM